MTNLAETVSALSEQMAALKARLEAHLAPKPRNTSRPRTGWRPGRHRFGLRPHPRIPGRLVEDSEEQQTIALIVQASADGMGPRTICRLLDSLGRPRRGKRWYPYGHPLVMAILRRAT
jgi:hypothetical protein